MTDHGESSIVLDSTRPASSRYATELKPTQTGTRSDCLKKDSKQQILYHPLKEYQIRLLRAKSYDANAKQLRCTLKTYHLYNCPSYSAISYTWKDPIDESIGPKCDDEHCCIVPSVIVNGQAVRIGSNLASALMQLYRREDRLVWADQICIDQENLTERSAQVAIMQHIFNAGAKVNVWLGRSTVHSTTACRALEPFASLPHGWALLEDNTDFAHIHNIAGTDGIIGFRAILDVEYWRRTWILQELLVNDEVSILWGHAHVSFRALEEILDSLNVNDIPKLLGYDRHSSTLHQVVSNLWYVCNEWGNYRTAIKSLIDILNYTRGTLQTDPRDAVYAKMCLISREERKLLVPDYKQPVGKLFSRMVEVFGRNYRSLYVICLADFATCSHGDFVYPSWVPDWTRAKPTYPLARGTLSVPQERERWYVDCFRGMDMSTNSWQVSGEEDHILRAQGYVFSSIAGDDQIDRNHHHETVFLGGQCEWETENKQWSAAQVLALIYDTLEGCATKALFPSLTDDERAYFMLRRLGHVADFEPLDAEFTQTRAELQSRYKILRTMTFAGKRLDCWVQNFIQEFMAEQKETSPEAFSMIWWRSYQEFGRNRVLRATSGTGRPVLAPKEVQTGDLICLLLNCPVPVVLRRSDKHPNGFVLVGECHVGGIMRGELVEEIQSGTHELIEFEIY